jgi:glutamine amidotransferase-like uncharacterized protein
MYPLIKSALVAQLVERGTSMLGICRGLRFKSVREQFIFTSSSLRRLGLELKLLFCGVGGGPWWIGPLWPGNGETHLATAISGGNKVPV